MLGTLTLSLLLTSLLPPEAEATAYLGLFKTIEAAKIPARALTCETKYQRRSDDTVLCLVGTRQRVYYFRCSYKAVLCQEITPAQAEIRYQ